ncbi:helix-turn-helix domain-containing protein [Chitinophaga sp. XS-30]|uniref:winged helix-turn-helix transcriptional regulator n=1 Tax=Chitinophaga sp. XS-30 TaxID=2604421 RepID=UPI0011DCFB36|nr:helix-turn-helix domain-containing protein [Chitinophaga sp. XS-30]QEH40913.1 helix-turn-helix transcriptional regulator [Chitinophaga sp. XS-30]
MLQLQTISAEWEACSALSAVQDALYVLNGKWKLPIIVALSSGNKRFNELQKTVKGIAAKVLSHELKELELNGFLIRKVHNGTPVMVEYELTDYSNTLGDVVRSLRDWGVMHREKIRSQLKQKDPRPQPEILKKIS